MGLFTAVSYLPVGHVRLVIPAANTNLLAVIYGVQAGTATLVFAVSLFAFGLVQGRGRLTYRDFLRRTWALPLATFNVASLAFNGMVLLGLGLQTPGTATVPGHGWAVTEASVVALSSIVTIVVVLAGTVRAIDPDTEADVRRVYRETAVAVAARSELLQDKSLDIMKDWRRPAAFAPVWSGPGRPVAFRGPGQGIVRDVSVWRLHVIALLGAAFRRSAPVVQAWPGKPVRADDPLITIDASSGWLAYRWARWCVSVRAASSDRLERALAALHGETLEHIRAGQAAEAQEGLQAFLGLQHVLWKAYAAHGRVYGPDPGRTVVRYARGPGDRIEELLNELLRAAAVSRDPAIQQQASGLPRVIASEALYQEVPTSVRCALRVLEDVYIEIADELSDGGGRGLPATGLAQRRLDAPFGSLLAFTGGLYLGQAIDQAASGASISWDHKRLPPADFLLGQLQTANEEMLRMLRHAVLLGDSATAVRALAKWKIPDLPLARNAAELEENADAHPVGDSGAPQPAGGLAQALADAQDCLDAMLLRLLVTTLDAGRATRQKAAAPALSDGVPDAVAEAILARLPDGGLWRALETAIRISGGDWTWQTRDDGIAVSGEVIIGTVDTVSPLTEAFALAAIARPRLIADAAPSRELALDRGQSLTTAIAQAVSREERWLTRHGCPPDEAGRNADALKEQLKKSAEAARDERENEVRATPVRADIQDNAARRARAAFRERDITGALFAQAGKVAEGGVGLHPITIEYNANRRWFTSADGTGWDAGDLGTRLGAALAVRSLQYSHLVTAREAKARAVRLENAAEAVREAIAELSASPTGRGRRPEASRTVVLLPDLAYADREALQIERAGQNGRLAADASKALRQFGLEGEGLAVQVLGLIDRTPVIETGVLQRNEAGVRESNIVVVDLARFGVLRRGASEGARPPEPELALYEPPDSLRPDSGATPVTENPPGPLEVHVSLSLLSGIDVKDPAAVRVIRLE